MWRCSFSQLFAGFSNSRSGIAFHWKTLWLGCLSQQGAPALSAASMPTLGTCNESYKDQAATERGKENVAKLVDTKKEGGKGSSGDIMPRKTKMSAKKIAQLVYFIIILAAPFWAYFKMASAKDR